MKKELTEQERYDLAHELYFLAAYLDSEREFYGDEDEEAKYQDMYEYYSIEAINKFGVLGIKIKVVD